MSFKFGTGSLSLPDYLLTEGSEAPSRLRVDVGSTGFFAGKEFRFFYEFNITSGESAWVKVVVNTPSTLKFQWFSIDDGSLRFRAWRDATEVGPFSAPASPTSGLLNRNPEAQAEFGYVGQNVVTIGGDGAATTGSATVSEIVRLVTSGATAQQISVGNTATQERGISPATYFLQLENVGNGACQGVYSFVLEERG